MDGGCYHLRQLHPMKQMQRAIDDWLSRALSVFFGLRVPSVTESSREAAVDSEHTETSQAIHYVMFYGENNHDETVDKLI